LASGSQEVINLKKISWPLHSATHLLFLLNYPKKISWTGWIARLWRRMMAALQHLAIVVYCAPYRDAQVSRAQGCAGASLALHHHKHTLHPVQLIFLG
jgi:hypothetical protein